MVSLRLSLGLLAAAMLLLALLARESSLLPDGRLHVYVLDVGQGDSSLIVTPSGQQILVDGGPSTAVLSHLGRFVPFTDRAIELLVLTHPDSDHVTALPDVLRRYRIEHVLTSGIADDLPRYQAFLAELQREGATVLLPDPRTDIVFGDGVVLDILWPEERLLGATPRNTNDTSIALRILSGNAHILLPGDIERRAEEALLRSPQDLRAEVLHAAHHGSETSSSTGFLLAVQPDVAVISAGRGNRYGHPHLSVLERFSSLAIPVRSTIDEGTIHLVWNGPSEKAPLRLQAADSRP